MESIERHTPMKRVRTWVEDWQRRRRNLAELSEMPEHELAQLAGDVGLSPDDLRRLGGGNLDAGELMPARLEAVGLSPEAVRACEPAVWQDLQRVCSHCRKARTCRRDMAHGDIETGMREYCGNAPTIDALLLSQDL